MLHSHILVEFQSANETERIDFRRWWDGNSRKWNPFITRLHLVSMTTAFPMPIKLQRLILFFIFIALSFIDFKLHFGVCYYFSYLFSSTPNSIDQFFPSLLHAVTTRCRIAVVDSCLCRNIDEIANGMRNFILTIKQIEYNRSSIICWLLPLLLFIVFIIFINENL